MEKKFFNYYFEYGGTVGNLISNSGNYCGIYLIGLPENFKKQPFNECSKLKMWKDRKVSVPIEELTNKWVENTDILYIGKSESKIVKKRIIEHFTFWNGNKTAAYGGRVIGQIPNFENLYVWYLKCEQPKEIEKKLLKMFKNQYGKLPFANYSL